jgi:bacteriocin biosynthesis cyclodehydratase domain-containing protein
VTRATVRLVRSGAFARELAGPLTAALRGAGYRVRPVPAAAEPGDTEPGDTEPAAGEPGDTAVGTSIGVLVADHDDRVAADLPARWHAAGMPSLVVAQRHPDVRVGPLDVPGTELCGACFTTRQRQHDPTAPDPGTDPAPPGATSVDGFPPYVLAAVVALAVDRLTVIDAKPVPPNEITVVNTVTLVSRTYPVVAVNLCPWCADQKPVGVLAGQQPMFPDLLAGVPR